MLPTRKNLKAIGLTEDQIDSVIEMHTETVGGLKEKLRIAEEGKSNAENLQNQLVDLQKKLQQAEKYKEQYDTEKAAHDKLKSEIAGKEQKAKEDAALTRYLKANGYKDIGIKKVLKYGNFKPELDDKGEVKDEGGKLLNSVDEEWHEFKEQIVKEGAGIATPPTSTHSSNNSSSTGRAKQLAQQYHDNIYGASGTSNNNTGKGE